MKVRRVVTGQDGAGKSVFVADEQVDGDTLAVMPGYEFLTLWSGDSPPSLPADGKPSTGLAYFPPEAGYRFIFVTFPPDTQAGAPPADLDMQQAMDDVNEKLPGMMEHMEPDNPGMHTTDTVDLDVVLAGDIWLELDDGAEAHLTRGDCVIQNGTRHAWHNRSSTPCTLLSVLVGGRRGG